MTTKRALAATLGDREGALAPKLERLLPGVIDRFETVAVRGTTVTHETLLSLLDAAGVVTSLSEPNRDLIGRHRREAVAAALAQTDASRVVYMDLDHLLRWIENDPSELDWMLEESDGFDCTVIGRGPRSFAEVPDRLASTEKIVNHVYQLMTGRPWDLMMAARSLSRRAAEAIVDGCSVDTIGNDVAWPLFCEARGFSMGYVDAEGLTYRTNVDYAEGLVDSLDTDPRSWATRVQLAAQHIDAMLPYMRDRS